MKIILCTFLLCITTVSVFGQSVELNGIVGQNVKFPAAVKNGGFLMYSGVTIGDSSLGTPGIGNYRGRLDWDSCTGLFSLSGLKMEDIGEYKVHNNDQIIAVFQLNVYAVSVFGEPQELNGVLGQSVKFPAAVKKGGFLIHSTLTIGEVTSGIFRTLRSEKYRYRVQWDSSTGFFSLSGLKMEDIGEYKVQNTDQNINTVFQLNVYTASVFGEPQELHGILGKSIKFPAAVKKGGSLMYGTLTIGEVDSGRFTPSRNEKYSGRLQWGSSTGLFSLSGLKMEDIGEYKVQNTDQNINTVFQLNVYIPVSKPHVNVTRNEYRCTLLCTVDKGTRATLSWYREGEKESYGSSPVESAPHLYLPLSVERSGTYTCKAKNSVSNETSDPLTVGAHCTVTDSFSTGRIVFLSVAVAALIAGVCAVCCCCNRSKHPTTDDNLIYHPEATEKMTSSHEEP